MISTPKTAGGLALDPMRSAGTLNARQHAAALAYQALRRRFESATRAYRHRPGGACLSDAAYLVVKRNHAALLRAVSAERWPLDRLCLEDGGPLSSEVERVRAALERVAERVG